MNWISFKKQRPKEEPKRRILVLTRDGDAYSIWSDDPFVMPVLGPIYSRTHWAEIEPPKETYVQPVDKWLESATKIKWQKPEPPPKPDPFEETFERIKVQLGITPEEKPVARAFWDAAIKWKEG